MMTMEKALRQEFERLNNLQPIPEPPAPECPLCEDLGYIADDATYSVRPCECSIRKAEIKRWQAYLSSVERSAGKGEEVAIANAVNPRLGKIQSVIDEWKKNRDCKAILMRGKSGTGKTCAAHYIARRIMKTHGLRGRFVDVRHLAMMVPRMVNSSEAASYVEDVEDWVMDEDIVLVLDDVGGESNRDSVRTRIHDYLNQRFLQRSWTIVTTNLSREELSEQYGDVVIQRCLAGARWMFPVTVDGENIRAKTRDPR